jgi:hypothetical protein
MTSPHHSPPHKHLATECHHAEAASSKVPTTRVPGKPASHTKIARTLALPSRAGARPLTPRRRHRASMRLCRITPRVERATVAPSARRAHSTADLDAKAVDENVPHACARREIHAAKATSDHIQFKSIPLSSD